MKFIATTSEKIKDIAIISGQLIISRDDRVIYLDAGTERTSYQQIITVFDEETRQNLASPLQGFYFVMDTKVLWYYDKIKWNQLTDKPKESIIFISHEDFPQFGEENVLYVDEKTIYRWNKETNVYLELGSLTWDSIS